MNTRLIRSVTGRDTLDGYDFTTPTAPRPAATPTPVAAPQEPVMNVRERVIARSEELNAVTAKQTNMITWKLNNLAKIDPDGAQSMRDYLSKHPVADKAAASELINRIVKRTSAIESGEIVVSRPDMTRAAAVAAPAKPKFDTYDDITDGNYAYERDGKTHFYRISRSDGKGQYAGRTFLNIQERASEDLFSVRGSWPVRKSILDAIRGAGVDAAHRMYSDRLGRCWHCNIILTDDATNPYRRYGLGPVCGPKVMG